MTCSGEAVAGFLLFGVFRGPSHAEVMVDTKVGTVDKRYVKYNLNHTHLFTITMHFNHAVYIH